MKKSSFSAFVCCLLLTLGVFSQTRSLLSVDFEDGMPAGWTSSSGSGVKLDTAFAILGEQHLTLTPSVSGDSVYLLSPEIKIQPGEIVRLEFNHIPMLSNEAGAQIILMTDQAYRPLNQTSKDPPSCYDATYGGGITQSFQGRFYKNSYWLNTGDDNFTINNLFGSMKYFIFPH